MDATLQFSCIDDSDQEGTTIAKALNGEDSRFSNVNRHKVTSAIESCLRRLILLAHQTESEDRRAS